MINQFQRAKLNNMQNKTIWKKDTSDVATVQTVGYLCIICQSEKLVTVIYLHIYLFYLLDLHLWNKLFRARLFRSFIIRDGKLILF